jgi:hypothetical protein
LRGRGEPPTLAFLRSRAVVLSGTGFGGRCAAPASRWSSCLKPAPCRHRRITTWIGSRCEAGTFDRPCYAPASFGPERTGGGGSAACRRRRFGVRRGGKSWDHQQANLWQSRADCCADTGRPPPIFVQLRIARDEREPFGICLCAGSAAFRPALAAERPVK